MRAVFDEVEAEAGLKTGLRAEVEAEVGPARCGAVCDEALRSLDYQATLFEALAAWRQTFLGYYRWLDTGDTRAWSQWRAGRQQFEVAAREHVARFGADLDFPAFDLQSASDAAAAGERGVWARRLIAGLLIALVVLLGLGSPLGQRWSVLAKSPARASVSRLTWTAAVTPWRLVREPIDIERSAAVSLLAIVLVGLLVATLTSFTAASMATDSAIFIAIVALVFESTAIGVAGRQGRGRLLVASLGPLLPGVILLFTLIAWFGPLGFWYRFWTSSAFRIVVVTTGLAMALWTAYMMLAAHATGGWRGRVAGCLAATGAAFLTLTTLLPGWFDTLRFLDRPLNVAPATDTMLFALRTYAGVSLGVGNIPYVMGAVLLAAGYSLWLRSMLATPRH